MSTAVLMDFDGTITMRDSSELALRYFAPGRWEIFDDMLDHGEISLEECMRRQFALVEANPGEIIDYLDTVIEIREGFKPFLEFILSNSSHVGLVSAGLDFFIRSVFSRMMIGTELQIIAGTAIWEDGTIRVDFPSIRNKGAMDFKQDAVLDLRGRCESIIYIGDGSSDYNAARACDLTYAVEGSRLAKLCEKESLPFRTFSTFTELIYDISKFL